MKQGFPFLFFAGLCVSASISVACIQTVLIEAPKDPRQLPSDIFKQHGRVETLSLALEMPVMGGGIIKLPPKKPKVEAQGDYASFIKAYEADPAKSHTFAERNDYGASLLFAGRFAEAVAVLVELEKDCPGQYATASNLGTAYELTGDLTKALEWLNAGILRNTKSHDSTEWLHVAIVEAKLELKQNPSWLVGHSVLDGHRELPTENLQRALEFQLNERLYFIHEDDPVMCDLFYEAALVATDSAKKAYFLRQAPLFGSIRDEQLRKLKESL